MASDKPLATTARTAQQDPPARKRLSSPPTGAGLITGPAAGLDTGPATNPQAVQAQADDRKRDDRGPGGGRRGRHPAPRPAPDPAAERTAIQPAYAATQPVQSMKNLLVLSERLIELGVIGTIFGGKHAKPNRKHQPGGEGKLLHSRESSVFY